MTSTNAHTTAHTNTPEYAGLFSAEKTMLSVLDYMENLCKVYQEEKEALDLRDMKRFADIQYLKVSLVTECEQRIGDMKLHQVHVKTASPALKERILTTQATLNSLAEESARVCKIRAESTRRIQDRLLEAARHILGKNQKTYNKRGQASSTAGGRVTSGSINQAI